MTTYEKVKRELQNNPKTWLITGVAGFIGSNLLETLLKLNQNVVGLDNFETGFKHNIDLDLSKENSNQREIALKKLYFEYKNKNYGAYCTYEPEGRGICDIGMYDLSSSRDIEPPLFDELYEQVREYFREQFHITEKILDW